MLIKTIFHNYYILLYELNCIHLNQIILKLGNVNVNINPIMVIFISTIINKTTNSEGLYIVIATNG